MLAKLRRLGATPLIVAAAAAMLAGCGANSAAEGRRVQPARVVPIGGRPTVVLTPLGASRIGLQTALATAAGKQTVVPVGALLYEPTGQAAVYARTGTLFYNIQFVTVAAINGNDVILSQGLAPGTVVVTQGAEELLGVQNGIGVET
jgi:hypothetical protein